MILGITGGSGCGKTTLLNVLRDNDALLLDCDAIYHNLLESDCQLLKEIQERFPAAFPEGQFDRKKLGAIVYSDSLALQDLNRITHTAVKREVCSQLQKNESLAAIDAIALFESGLAEMCDLTIGVIAPTEARIERLLKRDQITREYAISRIHAQHDDLWFQERCDYILNNCGTQEEFQEKCKTFLKSKGIVK